MIELCIPQTLIKNNPERVNILEKLKAGFHAGIVQIATSFLRYDAGRESDEGDLTDGVKSPIDLTPRPSNTHI